MRLSPMVFALALCAASLSAAQAQNAAPALPHVQTSQVPALPTFSYDAQHGMINAAGVQSNVTPAAVPSGPPNVGSVTITLNIKILSDFRPGTRFHCSTMVVGGELNTDTGLVSGGLETANGFAKRSGPGMATCTLTIPYSWTLPHGIPASNGFIIAYGARAVSGEGRDKEIARSTFQVNGIEPLPSPNGLALSFAFDIAL